MSMLALTTRDPATYFPPPRKVDLAMTGLATLTDSFPSRSLLKQADEGRFRRLRHIHALSQPHLMQDSLEYVSQTGLQDMTEGIVPLDSAKPILTGGELVASVHDVVARAACAAAVDESIQLTPRRGLLKAGWALFVDNRTLALVVAPPVEFGADAIREFVSMRQYRYPSCDAKRPFTSAERLWATLHDVATQGPQRPKFFIVSTYNAWIFGCFSEHLTTAWVSQPLVFSSRTADVLGMVYYWLASAGGAPNTHKVPAVAERPLCHLPGMQLHTGTLREPAPVTRASAFHLLMARRAINCQRAVPVPEPGSWASSETWSLLHADSELEGGRGAASGNPLARLGMRLYRSPPKVLPFESFGSGGPPSTDFDDTPAAVAILMEHFAMSCEPFLRDQIEDDDEAFNADIYPVGLKDYYY